MTNKELSPKQLQQMIETAQAYIPTLKALLQEATAGIPNNEKPEALAFRMGKASFQRVAQGAKLTRPEARIGMSAFLQAGIIEARGQTANDEFHDTLNSKQLDKRLHNERPVMLHIRPLDVAHLLTMAENQRDANFITNEIRS